MKFCINILVFLTLSLTGYTQGKEKKQVIFDTDIGPDYDDVGAIAMLHNLADKGEVDILATISCNHHYLTGPTLEIFNTYFKRPNIPIAVPKGLAANLGASQKWPQMLMEKYPHKLNTNDDFPNAVNLYRKILSEAKDSSVVIVAVGFLTNLSDLLNSPKDKISNQTGFELVSKKVKKLVSMAGKFPEGREYNVYKDTVSAINVFNNWPTKIIFSGWEIGNEIKTGLKLIKNKKLNNSPVKDTYVHSIPMQKQDAEGRMSWDQTAVLVGVRGTDSYFGVKRGTAKLGNNGYNYWKDDSLGKHFYLIEKMDYKKLTDTIEDLMMR